MDAIQIQQPNYIGTQIGVLKGHTKAVTKICVAPNDPDILITASRDKSILLWHLFSDSGEINGTLKKSFVGHNHFVSDCAISKDGGFMISSSWDSTLRLWDIQHGVTKRTFVGHTSDVTSVAFSMDNRQIVSGSRDRTIRLWNTLAVQKYVFEDDGHQDCVSSVLTSPQSAALSIVSGGWDGLVKSWTMNPAKCRRTFYGHTNAVNSLSICPDGSMMASGSKDGSINLWRLQKNEIIKKYVANASVSAVSFNPRYFFLAAGVGHNINLYNVETHKMYQTLVPVESIDSKSKPKVTSLNWSNDGMCLYAGYDDACIRIYTLRPESYEKR